jgi:hypothetical protein
MTLIDAGPPEIYELDINAFRLMLKSLEDDPEGMPFLKTHVHYPPVNVGGVTLSRVIEILDPYTVTFEDGQYAVNLVGANSNVGDRVNVNQVSIRSANSAGLVDQDLGEVWDEILAEHMDDGTTGETLGKLKGKRTVPAP